MGMKLPPVFTFISFLPSFLCPFFCSSLRFVEGRLFYSFFSLSFSFLRLLFLSHLFGYFVVRFPWLNLLCSFVLFFCFTLYLSLSVTGYSSLSLQPSTYSFLYI